MAGVRNDLFRNQHEVQNYPQYNSPVLHFCHLVYLQADKKVPGNFGSDISAYYEFTNNIDMLVENAFR